MTRRELRVPVAGGELVGWVAGSGPRVLLLHGGPALGYEYLDGLAEDLGDGFTLASYQQRGLAPSTTDGPFDMATHADDAAAVLDCLGWPTAFLVGHSWGSHLAAQLLARLPGRFDGALLVDGLGAAVPGGAAEFGAELTARAPAADQARLAELAGAEAGTTTEEEELELLALVWAGYFADPAVTMPMGEQRLGLPAHEATWVALNEDLPALQAALPDIDVPVAVVHGERSPMPLSASRDTADALGNAELVVVEGAGHFLWFEAPGAVGDALRRVIARSADVGR